MRKIALGKVTAFLLISLLTVACTGGGSDRVPQPRLPETAFQDYARNERGEIVTLYVALPGEVEPTPVTVTSVAGLLVYDGDIEIGTAGDLEASELAPQGIVLRPFIRSLWPNGLVPYRIDPALSTRLHDNGLSFDVLITQAIGQWEERTNVRFLELTSENESAYPDYVLFQADELGCSAPIGRYRGVHRVRLARGCGLATIIHEIGHVVGLFHEQSRSDRNDFVEIKLENVRPGPGTVHQPTYYHHNFQRESILGRNFGIYDYESIMHYPSWAFARDEEACARGDSDACTVIPKQAVAKPIGYAQALSDGDIAAVHDLYPTTVLATSLDPAYLYSIELSTRGSDTRLGRLVSSGEITDIATCPDGSVFASSFYDLYRVNMDSAVATVVGSFDQPLAVNSLACSPSGELFGGAGTSATDQGVLLWIDKDTGTGTVVGATGVNGFVGDISFGPGGVLHALVFSGSRNHLATINLTTGRATLVGQIEVGSLFGLVFDGNRLFALQSVSNVTVPNGRLYAVDPRTGGTTFLRNMAFNPSGAAPMSVLEAAQR